MNSAFLQLILLGNIFLIGAITAIAAQHAYAHFRPNGNEEKPRPEAQTIHLPNEVKEHLLQSAQTNFQHVLNRSTNEFQHELQTTTEQLNKQLEKLGTEILSDEMKSYRAKLDELRQHTETAISGAQTKISEHQTELKAKLTEEIETEKQMLIQQIDTKLADAVTSFLFETMQHNIDLGSQSTYLTTMLEEHKNELIKGIADET